MDADGRITYSSIETVNVKNEKQPIVFPNPVTSSTLNVESGTEKITLIRIYDMQFKAIKTILNTSGQQKVTIAISSMVNGVYIVEIQTTRNRYNQKISVNR